MENRDQRAMIGMLFIVCVLIAGMLLNQWAVVLYAGLALIGVSLVAGMRTTLLPAMVALIYALLFSLTVWLSFLQPDAYILGWRPATFIVVYLIWPLGSILGVFFAVLFSKEQRTLSNRARGLEG